MDTVAQDQKNAIILFDGVCNLCNASVRFVISRDRGDRNKLLSASDMCPVKKD